MDIDKLTEQILEITNNSYYGWIDLDSSDADRIRVALTKALTTPVVVWQSELLCEGLHNTDFNGKCFKCGEQVFVREPK